MIQLLLNFTQAHSHSHFLTYWRLVRTSVTFRCAVYCSGIQFYWIRKNNNEKKKIEPDMEERSVTPVWDHCFYVPSPFFLLLFVQVEPISFLTMRTLEGKFLPLLVYVSKTSWGSDNTSRSLVPVGLWCLFRNWRTFTEVCWSTLHMKRGSHFLNT